MADDIRTVRFNPPVYKNKTTDPGVLAKAGDTITALLKGIDPSGEHPTVEIVIFTANESSTEFTYSPNAANGYVMPNRIVGVTPVHTWECPPAGDYAQVGTTLTSVTSFQVGSKPVHTETYPATAQGAKDLQADMNAELQGNGSATVSWVDAATDYLKVFVMNTTAVVKVNGTALPVLVSP